VLYLSLDLETTGLDPKEDQILMVGAVVEDTEHPEVPVEELPYFCCYVRHDRYHGNGFALAMNWWILNITSGRSKQEVEHPIYDDVLSINWWGYKFHEFLDEQFSTPEDGKKPKIILAGKNVASFDYQFLPKELQNRFAHRFIDPGSVFIVWEVDKPLSLDDLKIELDIEGEVEHDALEDARDVIRVLRKSYGKTFKER